MFGVGLIDRSRLPLGVPYLPSYGSPLSPGLGGMLPGTALGPAAAGVPGLSPLGGFGGIPGMSPLAGIGGYPGMYGMPGTMAWPNTYPPSPGAWTGGAWPGHGNGIAGSAYLDGAWELSNGGVVIIEGQRARLYLTRDKYQDFRIAYDRDTLAWGPLRGGSSSRYRYQMRDNRMVLQDDEGRYLLLRRRR